MLVVDTNVLVYAANSTSQFHPPCREWLDRQRRRPDAWYITWAIVYEFLRVSTHPRILPRPWTAPAAWEFVAALLASPGLGHSRSDATPRRRCRSGVFGVALSRRQYRP